MQIVFSKPTWVHFALLGLALIATRIGWVVTTAHSARYTMQACLDIQRKDVKDFQPDIVVGAAGGRGEGLRLQGRRLAAP